MTGSKVVALALVLTLGLTLALPAVLHGQAGLIGDALRVFGIAYVVRVFGPQINDFINTLFQQHGVEWEGVTKVVPIVSVGAGVHVGAAQVQGPPELIDQTRAAGQAEATIAGVRARMLIPINTTNPTQDMTRIRGVGISALIDFRI